MDWRYGDFEQVNGAVVNDLRKELADLHAFSDDLEARIKRIERERDAFETALREIAYTGTSMPPDALMPADEWYRNIAFSLIGIAAKTLDSQRRLFP